MRDAHLEEVFPALKLGTYEITSPASPGQNCIGHALGAQLYFDPGVGGSFIEGHFWPPDIRRDDSVEAWTQLFQMCQFHDCADGKLEAGIEKIAIYVGDDGETSHCALQLPSGKWTSKIGRLQDIEHENLDDLLSHYANYTSIAKFMSRPRKG